MPARARPDSVIGELIRARRLLRGWSVRFAASRAGISHTSWSRIERGLQPAANRFTLADIAAALECSPSDLTVVPAPGGDRDTAAARSGADAIRKALVDVDLDEPAAGPGTTTDELARRLELVDGLRQACDYAGVGRLLPGLLRDAHVETAGPDRRRALRIFCDATFVASSVLRNLERPAEAWLGAERCREAAEASGDPVLAGYAAYARAGAAHACGSYQRGLTIAERAADELERHTGRPGGFVVLGSLRLMCALASAGRGRPDDSRAWWSEAADLARRTGETTTMGLYFGPANVGIWRVGIEAARDPGWAVAEAGGIDLAAVPARLRRVYYYADMAEALTRLGGRDLEAIRLLLAAERVAPQHVRTSMSSRWTAWTLLERSARQRGGTELRAMCERMGPRHG